MYSSKKTKFLNILCIILALSPGLIRLTRHHFPNVSSNSLICVLYITAVLIWLTQLRLRLLRKEERSYLVFAALLIVFLMVIRTTKYIFIPENTPAARYIWYLYYFPQTYVVLFMFFAVLYTGKPYGCSISPKWKLLHIPALLIVLGILTNDLHQLAFRFSGSISHWVEDEPYSYGPFYIASLIWLAVMFGAILILSFVHCISLDCRRNIWMPCIPLAAALIYLILFLKDPYSPLQQLFKTTDMITFLFPAFMEALIQAGLFPSNDQYSLMWKVSDLGAGIMDMQGKICYQSEKSLPVTETQVLAALSSPVTLADSNMVLNSHQIHGGYGYWLTDLSQIQQINKALANLGDVMAEQNSILEGENRLAEKKASIQQQNQLYDRISQDVSHQLFMLHTILADLPENEYAFENKMKYASVLMVYIKRRANLLLLINQQNWIPGKELSLSLAESLEYVRLSHITAYGTYQDEFSIPGVYALDIYQLFQQVLEACLPDTQALMLQLTITETIHFYMEISYPENIFPLLPAAKQIQALGGTVKTESDPDTLFLTVTFNARDFKGGDTT